MNDSLSPTDAQSYWRDGVLWPHRAMGAERAQTLGARLLELRDQIGKGAPGDTRALSYFPWEESGHPLLDFTRPIAHDPALTSVATQLLGPQLLLRNCDIFVKSRLAESDAAPTSVTYNAPIDWHRDDPFCPEADGMLTVWVALSAVVEKSGAVAYRLGSHRVGTPSTSFERGSFRPTAEVRAALDALPARAAEVRPGELIVHHANVVHRSGSNHTQLPRIGLAFRYLSPGVSPKVSGCSAAGVICGERSQACAYHLRDDFTINWWS